jgi:hypothetical protein
MLWNLLIVACFFTAVGSAWDSGRGLPMTVSGHILIAVIGTVIGAGCAYAMWSVGEAIGERALKLQSESQQKWLIRGIFASSILWIFLAAVLGRWASLTVAARLIRH